MRKSQRYGGMFSQIADLDQGERAAIRRPDDLTAAEFRKKVTNAVWWLGWSRKRKFKTRADPATDTIVVRRVHTDAELDAMGY